MLGITRTTVARALNETGNIKEETREKILKLANELGYEKNYLGSSLAKKSKKIIAAFLVRSLNEEYSERIKKGLKAVEKEVKAYGFKLEIYETNIDEPEEQLKILKEVLTRDLEGIIIIPLEIEEIRKILFSYYDKLKIISIGEKIFEETYNINSEYYKSGRIAGELMGSLVEESGKLLVFDGGDDKVSSKKYLNGFCDRIEELDKKYIGPLYIENMLENKEKILEFVTNDIKYLYLNRYAPEIVEYLKEQNVGNFKIIINGMSKKIRNLVFNGDVVATVSENLYDQGYTAGKVMFEMIYKPGLNKSQSYNSKVDIFIKENI
nr:substrate-binding domain-containing protein [uncultured Cetobacterium sp.]